jgi:uncharacterized 2Fe-2S/4Fe-4S cluster protein (DUF4445 family)
MDSMIVMTDSTLIFQPYGKRIKTNIFENILVTAIENGVLVSSICGGRGFCGKCRIIIRKGKELLSSPSEAERKALTNDDLKSGFRLACQTELLKRGTVVVEIPRESRIDEQRLLLSGLEKKIDLKPVVKTIFVSLNKPSLFDTLSDVDRLLYYLKSINKLSLKIDYKILKKTPHILRKGNWKTTVTVWNNREIIALEPGNSPDLYGFAIDVGTTKLAGYLIDLNTGKIKSVVSMMNPQIAYGEDVISRIHYIMKDKKNLEKLQKVLINGINTLLVEASKKTGISADKIVDFTLAGNTAMHHISLGIPPNYVSIMPYPAVLQSPIDIKARELGLKIGSGSYVHALPSIAGFVGGDAVADILATDVHKTSDLSMVIDIGTNTEIILGNKKGLLACSCASGPAFEGAHIKFGMRAATGAIEHVWIDPDSFDVGFKTIGDIKPRGICGSGIVDVIAEMLKARLIDQSGRFNKNLKTMRLRKSNGTNEFVISWRYETSINEDIVVTQSDIREIQLAKAAIYTGAYLLMSRMKINPEDIQKVYLAGAFGNYIDALNARIIGMYPDILLEKVHFVGNTAGSGARMTLVSHLERIETANIVRKVKYVELGAEHSFQNEFLMSTFLPHKEDNRFPYVKEILEKKN